MNIRVGMVAAIAACSTPPAVEAPSLSSTWSNEPAAPPATTPAEPTVDDSSLPTILPAEAAAGPLFPDGVFPPPSFEPPHAQSAREGDGVWTTVGSGEDRLVAYPDVMRKTIVRPHPVSNLATVTVVAVDLEKVSLHLVAGSEEPKNDDVGDEQRPAIVPLNAQPELLAVFNGGYKTNHGRWGSFIDGLELVPPRPEGCTIAMDGQGRVRIATWTSLIGEQAALVSWRQTPPCLLEGGELHPDLESKNERAWGGRDPKRKTRRRSAVGIDATGRVFFYALGRETGPRLLAEGLRAAGAAAAAQLDINWNWTRFLLVGEPDGKPLSITSTLVPDMKHRKRGYVEHRHPRDFFYLRLR